jgi:hypothetical protein
VQTLGSCLVPDEAGAPPRERAYRPRDVRAGCLSGCRNAIQREGIAEKRDSVPLTHVICKIGEEGRGKAAPGRRNVPVLKWPGRTLHYHSVLAPPWRAALARFSHSRGLAVHGRRDDKPWECTEGPRVLERGIEITLSNGRGASSPSLRPRRAGNPPPCPQGAPDIVAGAREAQKCSADTGDLGPSQSLLRGVASPQEWRTRRPGCSLSLVGEGPALG